MGETQTGPLKRTPLFENHVSRGARMVPFGGWEMPVQYSGVTDEHHNVRAKAGLFDVSHMGEVTVRGPKALAFLQYVTSNDVSKLTPGRAQYSYLPNPNGGVVDDIIVYQLGRDDYFLCVNASNTDKDFAWLTEQNRSFGVELKNVSADYGQVAVQGPQARTILAKLLSVPGTEVSPENFPSFNVRKFPLSLSGAAVELLVATTGYTGEDGCEIFCPAKVTSELWDRLLEIGAAEGIKPIGLGARDTLRLEACYPLHGHELSDNWSALSSGLGWVTKFQKGDFIGRNILEREKNDGSSQKLVGLEVIEPGIIREGNQLFDASGNEVGWVTSGTKPPTVNKAVGLAMVQTPLAEAGTELTADVRGRKLKVKVIKLPFYKRS